MEHSSLAVDAQLAADTDLIDRSDQALFWALYDYPLETLPDLDAMLERYGTLVMASNDSVCSTAGLERFMHESRQKGLIKKSRELSLRQYIGSLLPRR